jgi:cytochrome c oxidase assembly factor CtaG
MELSAWSWDPAVLLGVALAGVLYARGWLHLKRRGTGQAICFAAGLALIVLALCSPIGTYDQQLFSLHMTEHLLLALGAAPLLLLARPMVPLLWGLPTQERRGAGRLLRPHAPLTRFGTALVEPKVALALFSIGFAVWHVPTLYDAAQGQSAIHYLEHTVFFVTALLFWWPVIHPHGGPRRLSKFAAIVYFALPMFEGTLIGALLTFSTHPLYATYASAARLTGLSAVDDQQLAGLIMWIPGGAVYAAAVLALVIGILRDEETNELEHANVG